MFEPAGRFGADEVEPGEGQADQGGGGEAGSQRAEDSLRLGFACLGRKRPTQNDETDDESQDAQLHLRQRGQDGQRRGRLAMVAVQLAQAQ